MKFQYTYDALERAISNNSETGAAFVVTKDGETLLSGAAGLSDAETGRPFRTDTICRAFSCSKIVTSLACMILTERGRLDTGWQLSWVIPEFENPYCVRNGERLDSRPIKIRDLLNMTSGIGYPGAEYEGAQNTNELWGRLDRSISEGCSMTTQEFARSAGNQPILYPAGREWMYGASADILGAVIERVSGMSLSGFFRENIFDPLGMDDTAFFVPPEKRGRLAVLYEGAGENRRKPDRVNLCIYDYDKEPAFKSGGAGLFSTAEDFSRLGAALSDGGKGIIGRHTIDFMRTNGLNQKQRKTYNWDSVRGFGYGNLVRCLEDRNAAGLLAPEGSFGWDGWTGTFLLCDPAERVSVTVFLQRCGAGTSQLARDIVNTVYGQL